MNKEIKLKIRVSGVCIKDNKVLMVEMDHAGFYCLPGGHIELGEDSEYAMLREMEEETTHKFKISSYLGIIENFFYNKYKNNIHEICFYYLLDSIDSLNTEDYERIEDDHGHEVYLKFAWISLSELEKYNILPTHLKEILNRDNKEFKHIIVRD